MSIAISRTLPTRHVLWRILPWLVAVVSIGFLIFHLATDLPGKRWTSAASDAEVASLTAATGAAPSAGSATSVSLSGTKLGTAGVTTEKVRFDTLAAELGVPGAIELNTDRSVAIRSRAPGVVREVHVVLGQHVKRGEPLVTVDSADVGTARLNLRAKQRELQTTRIEVDWKNKIAETVASLIPQIIKGVGLDVLEKEFADKPLGTFRKILLQPYAAFDIAMREESKASKLRGEHIIGEHPAIVAKHTRLGLQAALFSAIEQAKFDAAQQKRLADQAVKLAESSVIDAGQRLRILGVEENIPDLIDHADQADRAAVDDDVTVYRIVAPFDGSIITRSAVPSQRADPNDLLFTLADLSTVWVSASIAESDVAKVPSVRGGPIRLTAAAYPGRVFEAKLLSFGSLVDPLTRTVPLLAGVDNAERLLRPGMFTRILLDGPADERSLTVPTSAVVEIEGRRGVFAPVSKGSEAETFAFRPIEVGREFGDRTAVKSGLKEGELVVAGGAFVLKSELILRNEPEEE